jgi:hypothetical protein
MPSLSRPRLFIALFAAIWAGVLVSSWEDLDPWLRGATVVVGVFLAAVAVLRERPATGNGGADPRLALIEQVVADESRRAWNPTTLPWTRTTTSPKPVLLVPAADYHLAEVTPLARELERRGIPTRVAIGQSPWTRTWQSLASEDLEVFELPNPDDIADQVSAVLVMKDTGSLGRWVDRCRELGLATIGKVEGAQDFWDADTPEERRPYRNLDLVLCQGQFDAESLAGSDTQVVGSTRLERLWWAPPVAAPDPLALINLNFVYGVRTADRKLWLDTAVQGCEMAGIPYVISTHPAEKSRIDSGRVTSISASRLLPHASVLISRFSTMPLEAMARGVPFVYHNPHGETVRTFTDPMGGFHITDSADGLAHAIKEANSSQAGYRSRVEPFFAAHIDIDPGKRSEVRSADVLSRLVESP